eukprot:1200317-Alexandrium_andersonii.AAC.1
MSASLVGSEMCIRDSNWLRVARNTCRWAACNNTSKGWGGAVALWRHMPVSYTHLTLPTICSV